MIVSAVAKWLTADVYGAKSMSQDCVQYITIAARLQSPEKTKFHPLSQKPRLIDGVSLTVVVPVVLAEDQLRHAMGTAGQDTFASFERLADLNAARPDGKTANLSGV